MKLVYSFALRSYYLLLKLIAPFNSRARLFLNARSKDSYKGKYPQGKEVLWIHCASHGEYETAKPIISRYCHAYHIHLTFYSPSGYNFASNNTSDWDSIEYLPIDIASEVSTYIDKVNPTAVIIIQYEFWYNLLMTLNAKSIPVAFYGITFRQDYFLFKPVIAFLAKAVNTCKLMLVKDEVSQTLASQHFDCPVHLAGEVRWLSSLNNIKVPPTKPLTVTTATDIPVITLASAWKEDIKLWKPTLIHYATFCHILIAPHDLSLENLVVFEAILDMRLTRRSANEVITLNSPGITLLDTLGELKYLYKYSALSYIGGGLGSGLHNCIEAAVHLNPILVAGDITLNPEVDSLIAAGLATHVNSSEELDAAIKLHLAANYDLAYRTYIDDQVATCNSVYSALDNFLN